MISWNEKDVEDYLYEHPESFKFGWNNNHVEKWIARQMRLPSGVLDLLGVTECGTFVLVEIKNVPVDSSAIAQVCRYAKDLEWVIGAANLENEEIPYLHKVVLSPDVKSRNVPNSVLFEAEALEVELRGFKCSAEVMIDVDSGLLAWTNEKMKDIYYERISLSENPIFKSIVRKDE